MAKSVSNSVLKGRWMVWLLALFFALIAGVGTLLIVGKAANRVSYFVVVADIPARTQITPDLVAEIPVTEDALPPTALTANDILGGTEFSEVPLQQGDILTTSVTGPLQKITYKLPKDFVAASLALSPERAVAGKVKAGDYIDIAAVNDDRAKIVLQHVLVLDVTISPSSIGSAANADPNDPDAQPGPEAAQVRGGIPQLYTVGVTQDDFAKLALIANDSLQVALSPEKTPSSTDASADRDEVFNGDGVSDSGAGTGSVFSGEEDGNPDTPGTTPTAAPSPSATSDAPSLTVLPNGSRVREYTDADGNVTLTECAPPEVDNWIECDGVDSSR